LARFLRSARWLFAASLAGRVDESTQEPFRAGITLLARPNSALDEEASLRYEYVQDYCTVMLRLVGGAGGGLLDPTDDP